MSDIGFIRICMLSITKALVFRGQHKMNENPKTVTITMSGGMSLEIQENFPTVQRIARSGVYDSMTGKILSEALREGSRCLDIGANVGYFTLLMGRAVGESGKVTAFEPDRVNRRLLQSNIENNGMCGRVDVKPVALGNDTGAAKVHLCETNPGDHRTYRPIGESRECYDVEMIRLDDIGEELGAFDVVKMDVQGYEGYVLEGGRNVFNAQPNITMVMEFCPQMLRDSVYGDDDMVTLIEHMGFSLFLMKPTIREISPDGLRRKSAATIGNKFFNILCIKQRR